MTGLFTVYLLSQYAVRQIHNKSKKVEFGLQCAVNDIIVVRPADDVTGRCQQPWNKAR